MLSYLKKQQRQLDDKLEKFSVYTTRELKEIQDEQVMSNKKFLDGFKVIKDNQVEMTMLI